MIKLICLLVAVVPFVTDAQPTTGQGEIDRFTEGCPEQAPVYQKYLEDLEDVYEGMDKLSAEEYAEYQKDRARYVRSGEGRKKMGRLRANHIRARNQFPKMDCEQMKRALASANGQLKTLRAFATRTRNGVGQFTIKEMDDFLDSHPQVFAPIPDPKSEPRYMCMRWDRQFKGCENLAYEPKPSRRGSQPATSTGTSR